MKSGQKNFFSIFFWIFREISTCRSPAHETPVVPSVTDTLHPHGREWLVKETLVVDPASKVAATTTKLKWPNSDLDHWSAPDRSPLDYFMLMYPKATLRDMLTFSSDRLLSRHRSPVSRSEFFRYLGGRLMMVCCPERGPLSVYWKKGQAIGSVYVGADFQERMHMTRHRFQDISSAMTFVENPDDLNITHMVSSSSLFDMSPVGIDHHHLHEPDVRTTSAKREG